jgi:hypothetical protein
MHRRYVRLVASVLGAALMAVPSFALGVEARMELGVSPRQVVIEARADGGPITQTLTVRVQATVAAEIKVAISDVVAGPSGNLLPAPLGSTPYSLGTSTIVEPALILVDPSPDLQTFDVKITVKAAASDAPHLGTLAVSLFPRGASGGVDGVVTQGLGMNATVLAGPPKGGEAAIANAQVTMEGSALNVVRTVPWTVFDQLIPDLVPGLVDHGPVLATVHYTNTGNVILDATTAFRFASVGPLAWLPGNTDEGSPFYTITAAPGYALPGQVMSTDADSLLRAKDAAPVDMLPFIGFVRITTTTSGTLGALAAAPVIQSTVIFIFPWKELLALVLLLVLLGVLRTLIGRGWRRARGRGKGSLATTGAATEAATPDTTAGDPLTGL